MNEELDYAEMLEIPVSTVNVVKKKSIFKHKPFAPKKDVAPAQDELKEMVVDSVNERVGAFTYAEDLSEPEKPEKRKGFSPRTRQVKLFSPSLSRCAFLRSLFSLQIYLCRQAPLILL